MSPETAYTALNLLTVFAWLALFVRPRHPLVLRCAGGIVPVVLALVYALLVVLRAGRVEGDFLSLAGVAALFRDPWILLAGWVHYLAFDLLIGTWEARDAAARNIPPWRLVPCLVLTFLLGPMGWLMYLGVRSLSSPAQPTPRPPSPGS